MDSPNGYRSREKVYEDVIEKVRREKLNINELQHLNRAHYATSSHP